MTQRVSFSLKEQRRNQRRPVAIEATLDGHTVQIIDISLTGVGGGGVELLQKQSTGLEEGQYTVLEFYGENNQRVSLNVEIRRVFEETGEFGAVFHDISSADFDAIEKLMFPRRGSGKA